MTTFAETGMLTFRTCLMKLEPAARFALCLEANPRFCAVEIQTSRRAKGERKYFVTYLPANPERVEAMVDRQQQARARRADEQEFVFCHDGDHDFYHCHSVASGEVYETTLNSCSCPDHTFRCHSSGLACKHRLALGDHIREERTIRFLPVAVTPENEAFCAVSAARAMRRMRETEEAERRRREEQAEFQRLFGDPNEEWLR